MKQILKIILSVSLLCIIAFKIDWAKLFENLGKLEMSFIFLSASLYVIDRVIGSINWKILLKAKGINISLKESFSFISVGMFFGLFLPSTLGGEIARFYDFSKYSSKPVDTFSSILIEKISGIFSLSIIALFSITLFYSFINMNIKVGTVFLFLSLAAIIIFLASGLFQKMTSFFFNKENRFINKMNKAFFSIREYKNNKGSLAVVVLLTFIIQLIRIMINYLNSKAMGMDIPIHFFFIYIPLSIIIMMAPIFFAGIGVREGVYLYFFCPLGLTSENAVLLGWLGFLFPVCFAILGGIIFLFRKDKNLLQGRNR